MFAYKKLSNFVFSVVFFGGFATCGAWGVWEGNLDEPTLQRVNRAFVACHMANAHVKGKGMEGTCSQQFDRVRCVSHTFQGPDAALSGGQLAVTMAVKDKEVFIGFSDLILGGSDSSAQAKVRAWLNNEKSTTDIVELGTIVNADKAVHGGGDKGSEGVSSNTVVGNRLLFTQMGFAPENSHSGSLQLWQNVSEDIRRFIEGVKTPQQGAEAETQVKDYSVTLAGHGVGGAAVQWGALSLIDGFYDKSNEGGKVSVITFGAPPIFTEETAGKWNKAVGEKDHLRFVIGRDPLLQTEGKLFNAFTGTEQMLKEGVFGVNLMGWWTGERLYHYLKFYEQGLKGRAGVYRFLKGTASDLIGAGGSVVGSVVSSGLGSLAGLVGLGQSSSSIPVSSGESAVLNEQGQETDPGVEQGTSGSGETGVDKGSVSAEPASAQEGSSS